MRNRTATGPIDAESLLTSHQAGLLLQVNPSSINNWVREGRIPAFRTPGGHRRIRAADLVTFLTDHDMPIPKDLLGATRRKVLWVDDDQKQLRSVEKLFKPFADKIDLRTIDNGIEALVQVGFFKPHLIVLDVIMPNLDGFEVVERLRANADTKEIDIIMASANIDNAQKRRAKALGVERVIDKPVTVDEVLDQLGVNQQAATAAAS
jgi:excisionase family DNA binding protein